MIELAIITIAAFALTTLIFTAYVSANVVGKRKNT